MSESLNCPILTDFYEYFDPEHPLPEYPRPQMQRDQWLNLNGPWDYSVTRLSETDPLVYEGKIIVPYPIESYLSGVQRPLQPIERLWYRRSFTVDPSWVNEGKLLLHFGAVDWKCEVWVNGISVGTHQGGYAPFTIDITGCLTTRNNEIRVSVTDPTDSFWQQHGKQHLEPQSIYYTAVSGIWQTVWIEHVPSVYISSLRITPDALKETLQLTVSGNDEFSYTAEVFDHEGKSVLSFNGHSSEMVTAPMKGARLWSPEDPYLYGLKITVKESGDTVDSYFAMRSFSLIKDGKGVPKIALNGKETFLLGVLDQGYWPEGIYTPAHDQAYWFDIMAMKKLGFNTLSKHNKIEPARWYYWADKLGMIVWQGMPAGGDTSIDVPLKIRGGLYISEPDDTEENYKRAGREASVSREDFINEMTEIVTALYNVPSIGIWNIFNEGWGQFDSVRVTGILRDLDSSRLIETVSGWIDQGAGDIRSNHYYFVKPFLPLKHDGRAMVISECGGLQYSVPWHRWSDKVYSTYRKLKSSEELLDAYSKLMLEAIVPLKSKGLSAVIYTQLSDIEIESNGILTYDRKVLKVNEREMININRIVKHQK